MNVVEAVGYIRRDLHTRDPSGENREIRVDFVPQARAQVGSLHEFVDEVDVLAGDGDSEEFDDAREVALADDAQFLPDV